MFRGCGVHLLSGTAYGELFAQVIGQGYSAMKRKLKLHAYVQVCFEPLWAVAQELVQLFRHSVHVECLRKVFVCMSIFRISNSHHVPVGTCLFPRMTEYTDVSRTRDHRNKAVCQLAHREGQPRSDGRFLVPLAW